MKASENNLEYGKNLKEEEKNMMWKMLRRKKLEKLKRIREEMKQKREGLNKYE